LRMDQGSISKIESRSDLLLSTLRSYVEAMGGSLRLIAEFPDGFVIHGPTELRGAEVSSGGDHRLAMMLAVAGTAGQGATIVEDAGAAAVSFPGFEDVLAQVGGNVKTYQPSPVSQQPADTVETMANN